MNYSPSGDPHQKAEGNINCTRISLRSHVDQRMYYFPLKEKLLVCIVHKVGFSEELLVSSHVGQLE